MPSAEDFKFGLGMALWWAARVVGEGGVALLLTTFLLIYNYDSFRRVGIGPGGPPAIPTGLLLPAIVDATISSVANDNGKTTKRFVRRVGCVKKDGRDFKHFGVAKTSFHRR